MTLEGRVFDPGGVAYGSRRVALCATAGCAAVDTFDPGGVAYNDSVRFDSKHAVSRCVRDPCRGRRMGPRWTGGSELTLATTGYRARPLRGRTPYRDARTYFFPSEQTRQANDAARLTSQPQHPTKT